MLRNKLAIISGAALTLLVLVLLAVAHYDWNVSALLRMDQAFGTHFRVPPGIILYQDGGYDGMLYYQIARDFPGFFFETVETPRRGVSTTPPYENTYRLQRILLPAFAFILSLGHERALPWSILSINLATVIGALALLLRRTKQNVFHALTIVFNPASLVGILFSLTEPLALFFAAAFLIRFTEKNNRLDAAALTFLTLSLFARETTIFLIALLFLAFLLEKNWKQAGLSLTPLLPFLLFQLFLTRLFGEVPFATGTGMVSTPLSGPLQLILHAIKEPNAHVLSSLSFLLFFVLPLLAIQLRRSLKEKRIDPLPFCLTGLTAVLLTLDAHIWGAITSVGRVLAPLYPVYAIIAGREDSLAYRFLSGALIAISIVTALGLALTVHPFVLS